VKDIVLGLVAGIVAAAASLASAQDPPAPPPSHPTTFRDRLYFGGAIGLSFGDIDYYQIAPVAGFHVTPKFSTGVALSWIRREYSEPVDVSTNDLGVDVFGRYRVLQNAFAQLQYSYFDFEVPLVSGGSVDETYSTVLAGAGWAQPLGNRASFVVSVLYDFGYSDDEPSPYDDPWVMSAGVAVGF
jgi:hypothetical protein